MFGLLKATAASQLDPVLGLTSAVAAASASCASGASSDIASSTVTEDGWLGIAPSGKEITMRSLDFWRCENGVIRENWVLVDILDIYSQLGVDVFVRLREMNKPGWSQAADAVTQVNHSTALESSFSKGLINEKQISQLPNATTLLKLGKHATITALARDKAKILGIKIERVA